MPADWPLQQPESWKLTLPCTRAEGEALAAGAPELDGIEPAPVAMTSEPDPDRPEAWQLDVYLSHEPDAAMVECIRALVPGAAGVPPHIERVADADWVTISQGFLEPIRAGRFFVHTAAHADAVPADAIAFRIEASRAFGTGHHETTAGCLEMLDGLACEGRDFAAIADIGTGTGLLAFAARALWPQARIIASDIDPIAIEVTAENMAINAVPATAIALVAAAGMDHPHLVQAAPFDLVIANILAGPLIDLARDIGASLQRGGTVILAGLLASQAGDVLAAYAAQGMVPAARIDRGQWAILSLVKAA
jgi:ribosomal protein L11 methyltransferase